MKLFAAVMSFSKGMILRYFTAEQVGIVGHCGVDCRIHGAWSVIINASYVDRIAGIQSVVSQPPDSTTVEYMHTTIVH